LGAKTINHIPFLISWGGRQKLITTGCGTPEVFRSDSVGKFGAAIAEPGYRCCRLFCISILMVIWFAHRI